MAHPSSFRDAAGHVFTENGIIYRQINRSHRDDYDQMMRSGLYDELVRENLVVSFVERDHPKLQLDEVYKIIEPQRIPFISYSSEWCHGQLRQAALATLEIQRKALEFGMTLKDASSFNIQFVGARPVLIDTLSLIRYDEGTPWIAYRQFCEHFLAPLALMSLVDVHAGRLLNAAIDGIPLPLASRLLPWHTRLRPSLLMHLHFHARLFAKGTVSADRRAKSIVTREGMLGLIDNLQGAIAGLTFRSRNSAWDSYYDHTNYTAAAMQAKATIVRGYLKAAQPDTVWDIGSNRGDFSRIAAEHARYVVSSDSDAASVENNYRQCLASDDQKILPLLLDIANPTPDFGWANAERMSFSRRGPFDIVMALALVHHLVISGGIPLTHIAEMFSTVCTSLIIEFPANSDSQVRQMLAQNTEAAARYSEEQFRHGFAERFRILQEDKIPGSDRTLFLMRSAAA